MSLVRKYAPPETPGRPRHSRESGNPEGWGEGNVVRGLVPRWGGGGAWQNPGCQFAVQSHNSSFSHLGVPAPAGMSDRYENALKRLSSAPATPRPSFRRRPESRGVGRGECSAGACPPLGSGWGVAESGVPIRRTKPQLQLFIPWCAGGSRHERLVRKWCYAASSMPECHRPPLRHSYENVPSN